MSKLKTTVRRVIFALPGGRVLWALAAKLSGRGPKPEFSGWGMTTFTFTPWHGGGDGLTREFLKTNADLTEKVKLGEFNLAQFSEVDDKPKLLGELMWRHYIVFWSAAYASKVTACRVKNIVECGVCDGLTVFFALSAAKSQSQAKAFLYDAWDAMRSEDLADSEKANAGAYSYLDIENTRRNLAVFHDDTAFNKGRIPGSFKTAVNPAEIVWLHIDLNAAMPTEAALHFFFDRIAPGGVVLFDDYAWHGFQDTRTAVDEFFSRKEGTLLPLPTGQAIYFKPVSECV
jgi:O-methyltransferase